MSDLFLFLVFILSLCIGWIPVILCSCIINQDIPKQNGSHSLFCDIMTKIKKMLKKKNERTIQDDTIRKPS